MSIQISISIRYDESVWNVASTLDCQANCLAFSIYHCECLSVIVHIQKYKTHKCNMLNTRKCVYVNCN